MPPRYQTSRQRVEDQRLRHPDRAGDCNRSFSRPIAARIPQVTVHGTSKTWARCWPRSTPIRAWRADHLAQQDRRHHGDRHRGAIGCHPWRTQETQPVALL